MSDQLNIRVGQIYQQFSKGVPVRFVKVIGIVERELHMRFEFRRVLRVGLMPCDAHGVQMGRITTINAERLKPGRNGFELVSEGSHA